MHVRLGELDTHRVRRARRPRSRLIARSSTPISTIPPWARSRAAGSGNAWREPMASCEPGGSAEGEGDDRVEALLVRHGFEVVDDEGDRFAHRRQRGDEAPGHLEPGARRGEGAEQRRREPFDPVPARRRCRSAGRWGRCRDHRRRPSRLVALALGPLHERRRLAIPGWGDDGQHGRPGCAEHRGEQLGTGDDPGRARGIWSLDSASPKGIAGCAGGSGSASLTLGTEVARSRTARP